MRATTATPFAVLTFAVIVAACGGTAAAIPPASERAVATPTVAPSQRAPESPAVEPSEPAPATPVPATPVPATPVPAPSEAPNENPGTDPKPAPITWTDVEHALLDGLRLDAQVDCSPRRTGLPDGATAGVECRIRDGLVERVGAYQFDDQESMLAVYLDRLADYGVEPRTGACESGIPGDRAYGPGEDPGTPLQSWRFGCFHDENGKANLRLMCDTAYVGVLGATEDIAALEEWASILDENFPGETPSAHGLCYGPADAWH